MALFAKDDAAARVTKATGDLETERRRFAAAAAKAAELDQAAAAVDPDGSAFGKATGAAAEAAARVRALGIRVKNAETALEEARAAETAAEIAERRARVEAIGGDVAARERRALDGFRAALAAFAGEAEAIAAAESEARNIEAKLRAQGVTDVRAVRAAMTGWAGASHGRLAYLACEFLRLGF